MRFHQVHEPDGARIEHKRIGADGEEVPYDEIVKGYEVSAGEYVVLEKEEIDAAAGERSRLLDIEEFVDAAEIDPVFFDRTYYLGARDARRRLPAAARGAGQDRQGRRSRAGSFHNREYLVAIRSIGPVLALHTMRFHDELVDASRPRHPRAAAQARPTARSRWRARSSTRCTRTSSPKMLTDTYRDHLLDYLERKREGKAPKPKAPKKPEASDDLLAALQASLER